MSMSKQVRKGQVANVLTFSALAWLKLQYFCHAGDTEIGGFAIASPANPLYVEDFHLVEQTASWVSVDFHDPAVADFFDRCVDRGLKPGQFARIWCHTHPGQSAEPSGPDEETFERCFGHCDWSVMFILSRTGETYARLRFRVGPGASLVLPVRVDWSTWPSSLADPALEGNDLQRSWQGEFEENVHAIPKELVGLPWWAESDFSTDPFHEEFIKETKFHEHEPLDAGRP